MNRIINSYTEKKNGPLLIVFGAMHGNEAAGVKAIEAVFKLINEEPKKNPEFSFHGKLVGMIGNLKAYQKKVRFLKKDMNRHFSKNHVDWIFSVSEDKLDAEDQEIKALINTIRKEIKNYNPTKLYILDIHTTSAQGGIFTIPSFDAESVKVALDIHVPVVEGMLKNIKGTTLHFFNKENMHIETTAITFEAGQHDDPESIKNAISALINCLHAVGCVERQNIEEKHNNHLYKISKGLPRRTRLIHRQAVRKDENFKMLPGFKNFQLITKNTLLATNIDGEIRNKEEARVLMPLYQPQGEDGFFLVKDVFQA